MNIAEFCRKIPKVELHAHLNGSLSDETLTDLGVPAETLGQYKLKDRNNSDSMARCFGLFKIAHSATASSKAVYKATSDVIKEFRLDNVIYLELRTTPRQEIGMSKIEYLEAVVDAIKHNTDDNILVKLTPSIDRTHSLSDSETSLDLIAQMADRHPNIITGVDFCGNPSKGVFHENLFRTARAKGLKVTLHCAEIENHPETKRILDYKPDRIGHATFVHPNYGGSEELWVKQCQLKIPTECCLTSNLLCGTVKNYENHHVREWKRDRLPFVLSTDDKGVFSTSLSDEYHLATQHLGFTRDDVYECCLNGIQMAFASVEEKLKLEQMLLNFNF